MSLELKVTYTDFHWDNYQGGAGKTVNGSYTFSVPDKVSMGEIDGYIHNNIDVNIKHKRPFSQDNHYIINLVEVLL